MHSAVKFTPHHHAACWKLSDSQMKKTQSASPLIKCPMEERISKNYTKGTNERGRKARDGSRVVCITKLNKGANEMIHNDSLKNSKIVCARCVNDAPSDSIPTFTYTNHIKASHKIS